MENTTVLIIDEDIEFLASSAALINSGSCIKNVLLAVSRESAEIEILIHNPDLIISDLGFSEVRRLIASSKRNSNPPFILMTGFYDNDDYLKLSRDTGANAFCLKKNLHRVVTPLMLYIKKGINSSIFENKYYLLK